MARTDKASLPEIPGFSPQPDGTLRNGTTGLVLINDPSSPDGRFRLEKVEDGETMIVAASDDVMDIEAAFAEAWLRHVAVHIGIGFNPDTRAADYEPPLESDLAREYDPILDLASRRLEDPYEISMDAWKQAGVAEFGPRTRH